MDGSVWDESKKAQNELSLEYIVVEERTKNLDQNKDWKLYLQVLGILIQYVRGIL